MFKKFIDDNVLLIDNVLSHKVQDHLRLYRAGKIAKDKLKNEYWKKIAYLSDMWDEISAENETLGVSEVYDVVKDSYTDPNTGFLRIKEKKLNAIVRNVIRYHGRKLVICHSYQQVRDKVASMLYVARDIEYGYQQCQRSGCTLPESVCSNCKYHVSNGRPEVLLYNFGNFYEVEVLCAPAKGYDINTEVINDWYEASNTSPEFFEELSKTDRGVEGTYLLATETPWLGFPTLKHMYLTLGHEYFEDVVDAYIESIQSEGQWDVEITTTKVRKEGSHVFVTTKAANGSVALSPRRMVYVESPKVRERYVTCWLDKVKLFLSLTFYKYAGLQPMLPVVEVETDVEGYTDYVIDYTNGNYLYECANDDFDIEDDDFDEEELDDEDAVDEDEEVRPDYSEEYDEEERTDVKIEWVEFSDDEDADSIEYGETSLMVTDDRKPEPFVFKVNF